MIDPVFNCVLVSAAHCSSGRDALSDASLPARHGQIAPCSFGVQIMNDRVQFVLLPAKLPDLPGVVDCAH